MLFFILGFRYNSSVLLLQDESNNLSSSGSETDANLEVDPARETDGEDEDSTLTQQQHSGQDVQKSSISLTVPIFKNRDLVIHYLQTANDLIKRPSRTILREKNKHKWSSFMSKGTK